MKDNNACDLIPLPKSAKPIGCKQIFKSKKDLKGNVDRYKARFIIKSFTKKE